MGEVFNQTLKTFAEGFACGDFTPGLEFRPGDLSRQHRAVLAFPCLSECRIVLLALLQPESPIVRRLTRQREAVSKSVFSLLGDGK